MPALFEFGPFRLDRSERTLVRVDLDGRAQPVAIGARALDLLLVLAGHAGQLVSKRRLLEAVWPCGAVEDSNLTVQVTNLRRIIDEGTPEPSRIRTVHGRGYMLVTDTAGEVERPRPRPVVGRQDNASLAVLPFRMRDGMPEWDDFAEGLVDDIVAELAGMRSITVLARRSASAFKGRAIDMRHVGRELDARYIMDGSVRRSGLKTRVTIELVETERGSQFWAGHFDESSGDAVELQGKLSARIAGAVEPRLQQAEVERARAQTAERPTAYELFYRALGLFHEQKEMSFHQALTLLDRAVALDPSYPAPYGLAAWCCRLLINYGRSGDDALRARGFHMASVAVSHGTNDPFTLALGGAQIALLGANHDEGLAHIDRALDLNANSARAWELRGWVSCAMGAHARSIESFENAMRLSPSDSLAALPYAGIAWPYFFTGRHEEGIAWADKACLEMPYSALPLRPKIACAALAGRADDVRQASERMRSIHGGFSIKGLMRIDVSRAQAQRDIVADALRKAGVPEA